MFESLKSLVERGELTPVLGAGASMTSLDVDGNNLPLGQPLASEIAEHFGMEYSGESLQDVYSAASHQFGPKVRSYLRDRFTNCRPSKSYRTLATFSWPRIYTLNIDDALEHAIRNNPTQRLVVKNFTDTIEDVDQTLQKLQLVSLNGNASRIESDGVIFSVEEYARGHERQRSWYEELANDLFSSTCVFIGSSLDEPLLFHHIERMKTIYGADAPTSYLIVPSISNIRKVALEASNIVYLQGTLDSFTDWLEDAFDEPISPSDAFLSKHPEIASIISSKAGTREAESAIGLLKEVTPVDRTTIRLLAGEREQGVRNFYRGFKPTWRDVLDGVPAHLSFFHDALKNVKECLETDKAIFCLLGPAGSGKSTLLMQIAYELGLNHDAPVYQLGRQSDRLLDIVEKLCRTQEKRFVICVERLEDHRFALVRIAENPRRYSRVLIIGTERQNTWSERLEQSFEKGSYAEFLVPNIESEDADLVLEKLERFGPWNRLSPLSKKQRRIEIFKRSKRQLLIGLLEATQGLGFEEIIHRDFESIADEEDRRCLLLIGLGTIHRTQVPEEIFLRALSHLGIRRKAATLNVSLSGIVYFINGNFQVRHHVYVRHLFEKIAEISTIRECIVALLYGFGVYSSPIIKSINSVASQLFKFTLNNRFLRDILHQDEEAVLSIYKEFEKKFEGDGHFWLQYGLSLRAFGRQREAMEKIQTALNAFNNAFIEHAFAQQQLILAEQADSRAVAVGYLQSASPILERLDRVLELHDAYPIVTLAEYTVRVFIRHYSEEEARREASRFANILESRIREDHAESRLKASWERMVRYSSTGIWEKSNED